MNNEQITPKACLEISKIKSMGALNSKMNHNLRLVEVKNANPALIHTNEELIKNYGNENIFDYNTDERMSKTISFVDRFKARINELDYYKSHNVRKNAVIAYEINMTYSPTAQIPIEKWKAANLEWLIKEFNISPDGKNNILSCIYHGDENNGHIHAIVVPINSKGKLCAKDFTGNWSQMVHFQDRYAKSMEQFGLERGTHGSQMEHTQVRKFYAEANKVLESIPKPLPGESAQEYFDRYREQLETVQASQYLKTKRICEEQKRQTDAYIQEQRQALNLELKEQKNTLAPESNNLKQANVDCENDIDISMQKAHLYDNLIMAQHLLEYMNPELSQIFMPIKNELENISYFIEDDITIDYNIFDYDYISTHILDYLNIDERKKVEEDLSQICDDPTSMDKINIIYPYIKKIRTSHIQEILSKFENTEFFREVFENIYKQITNNIIEKHLDKNEPINLQIPEEVVDDIEHER